METLILVDGTGLIYRGFYSIPPFFRSPAGQQTNAVFGFASIMLSILQTQNPTYLGIAFDMKGPTFRHEEYKEYKATRVKAPDELFAQIPLVKDLVTAMGIPMFELGGFEADDLIATIATAMAPKSPDAQCCRVLIATGDFDLFQLATPNISMLYPTKGFKQADIFGIPEIQAKYELAPSQIPDYKGLAGDSSDNIPGVRGIGPKGATTLLKQYKNLEGIYEHLVEIKGAMRTKLETYREDAFTSRRLATLRRDVPVTFDLESCRLGSLNVEKIRESFVKLGFRSLLGKLDSVFGTESEQNEATAPSYQGDPGPTFELETPQEPLPPGQFADFAESLKSDVFDADVAPLVSKNTVKGPDKKTELIDQPTLF